MGTVPSACSWRCDRYRCNPVAGLMSLCLRAATPELSPPLHFDELAWLTRWLALGFGRLFCCWPPGRRSDSAWPEHVGSLLLTVAGLMLVGVAGDLVLLFVALGADLDSHLRAALPRAARRGVAGIDGQVLLPERVSLGDSAVRIQFPLRNRRLDRVGRRSGGARRHEAAAAGLRGLRETGDGADLRRSVLQDRRRAVPLLRPRRVSGNHASQRGAACRSCPRRRDLWRWRESSSRPCRA